MDVGDLARKDHCRGEQIFITHSISTASEKKGEKKKIKMVNGMRALKFYVRMSDTLWRQRTFYDASFRWINFKQIECNVPLTAHLFLSPK